MLPVLGAQCPERGGCNLTVSEHISTPISVLQVGLQAHTNTQCTNPARFQETAEPPIGLPVSTQLPAGLLVSAQISRLHSSL